MEPVKRSLSVSSSDDDEGMPSSKKKTGMANKISTNFEMYNSVAQQMMQKMGHLSGKGLGKYGQGRVNIVEASTQRGRRGLGLQVTGLEPSVDIQWNSEDEVISVQEEVFWIPECNEETLTEAELNQMPREGPKKLNIEDETEFCSPDFINQVLAGKSIFDSLPPEELRKARTRSNPFETIRGAIFLNRAAMKMANMDYAFDFMFSNPVDDKGKSLVDQNELLYFADVCAGPGGFSEYILWKKQWHCKGFGFTLRGKNDFKLEDFYAGPAEMFEPHYGIKGSEGDGDVFVPENCESFTKFVLESTDNKGVHFVMADGGFSVEGQENIQEILSKRLYLCQFLFAMSILRKDGHFVCKLFDVFTPFSVGLIYLMYRSFKHVSIHKPNTSRPANSERYIICKWRRDNTEDVRNYLFNINCRFRDLERSDTDIMEVVPLDILKEDDKFYRYIVESNERIAHNQIVNLAKIKAFVQNTELYETCQSDMRKKCLEAWQVPDQVRSAPKDFNVKSIFHKLTNENDYTYLSDKPKELVESNLADLEQVYDYRCMVMGVGKDNNEDKGLLLSLGRSNVYKSSSYNDRWRKLDDIRIELPRNTLVYAEMVHELQGEARAQRKVKAVHIIDVLFIASEDVRKLDFMRRLSLGAKLVKAVSKPSQSGYAPIRIKEVHELRDIHLVFDRLDMRYTKNSSGPRMCYALSENKYFLPTGIYFIKVTIKPWIVAKSRSSGQFYYFNTRTKESSYPFPSSAIANFKACFANRLFWTWEPGVQLLNHHNKGHGKVHKSTICQYIDSTCS